jgi:hypothetical protein
MLEFSRWSVIKRAVRPFLVVVMPLSNEPARGLTLWLGERSLDGPAIGELSLDLL